MMMIQLKTTQKRAKPQKDELSRESVPICKRYIGAFPVFIFHPRTGGIVMERNPSLIKIINPQSEEVVREACQIYSLLNEITDNGCDVEVKKIKGKLKIIRVQKQVATEIIMRN